MVSRNTNIPDKLDEGFSAMDFCEYLRLELHIEWIKTKYLAWIA